MGVSKIFLKVQDTSPDTKRESVINQGNITELAKKVDRLSVIPGQESATEAANLELMNSVKNLVRTVEDGNADNKSEPNNLTRIVDLVYEARHTEIIPKADVALTAVTLNTRTQVMPGVSYTDSIDSKTQQVTQKPNDVDPAKILDKAAATETARPQLVPGLVYDPPVVKDDGSITQNSTRIQPEASNIKETANATKTQGPGIMPGKKYHSFNLMGNTVGNLISQKSEDFKAVDIDWAQIAIDSAKKLIDVSNYIVPGRKYISAASEEGAARKLYNALSFANINDMTHMLAGKWIPYYPGKVREYNMPSAPSLLPKEAVTALYRYAKYDSFVNLRADLANPKLLGNSYTTKTTTLSNPVLLATDQASRIPSSKGASSTDDDTRLNLPNWGNRKNFGSIGHGSDFYWGIELGNPDIDGLKCYAPKNPFLSTSYVESLGLGFSYLKPELGRNLQADDSNKGKLLYVPVLSYNLSGHYTGLMESLTGFGERFNLQVPTGFMYPRQLTFDVFETDTYIWDRYLRAYYDAIYFCNDKVSSTVLPYKNCCSTIRISVFYQTGQCYMWQDFYCIPELSGDLRGSITRDAKEISITWNIYGQSELSSTRLAADFSTKVNYAPKTDGHTKGIY